MSEEILRNYGHRGIDTKEERDLINYSPILTYIKKIAGEEKESFLDNFEPSEDLAYIVKYNIPNATRAVQEARTSFERCIALLKERLFDVVVEVDQTSIYKDLITEYAGGGLITFDVFDKACRESFSFSVSEGSKATMKHFMERADSIEALSYPDMVSLEEDLEECEGFVNGELIDLAIAAGYIHNSDGDIGRATEEKIKVWVDFETLAFLKPNLSPEQYISELGNTLEVSNKLYHLNNDPVPTISRLAISKAYDISSASDSFFNLLILDISDIIADEIDDIILGIFSGFDLDSLESYQEKYDQAKSYIRILRTVLTMTNATLNIKSIGLTEILMTLLSPFIRSITSSLLSTISRLKLHITTPALEYLANIEKNAGRNLRTIDKIANAVMDVADETEAKYKDIVLDYYRSTKQRTHRISEKIGGLDRKKWTQTIIELLNAIEWGLDRISPEQIEAILRPAVDTRGFVYDVASHLGWDFNKGGM